MSKKNRRVAKARRVLLSLSLVLVMMMVAVGGTIAWLTADTDPVTNTFTTSNIDITLTETEGELNEETDEREFQMVPGITLPKDPVVGVTAESEACWLFVKIDEVAATTDGTTAYKTFDDFISYAVATGWTQGKGLDSEGKGVPTNVWYRKVNASDAKKGVTYSVLENDQVKVLTTVDKEMMDALEADGATLPKLTFTAYASQLMNDTEELSVAEAWANIGQ